MITKSIKTYRFRIKDSQHRKHLTRMSWAVNYVWNYCNEVSILAWRRDKKWLSEYHLNSLTSGCGKELGLNSTTIQQICKEYVTRRNQYKKVKLSWRSKKRSLGWIPLKANSFQIRDDCIIYQKRYYQLWLSRKLIGKIKDGGSFSQDSRGRWYINIPCEVYDSPNHITNSDLEIGIDLGLKDIITCSDGVKYERENLTKKYEDELAMAQRAKKKKRITAIHTKIKNVRKDWIHKTTTDIAKRAKTIVVGDVSSSKLAKTKMAKSTYDAGWYQIKSHLSYKAVMLGGIYKSVNESFTSVTCSSCLQKTGPSGLSGLVVREWTCSNCQSVHDRDVNAAKNILRLGSQTPIKGAS